MLELIERPSPIADPEAPHPPPASPAVALESVTARYAPSGTPVLDGFDLVLPPGGRVALIGESGAGKSTVVNLLFRFHGQSILLITHRREGLDLVDRVIELRERTGARERLDAAPSRPGDQCGASRAQTLSRIRPGSRQSMIVPPKLRTPAENTAAPFSIS